LNEVLYRIIDIPEEALPSDVQRMSVQLKIDPDELRMEGALHAAAAEEEPAAQEVSTNLERAPGCGAGACGSGGAIVIAGTLVGLGLTKSRARQRRSQRRPSR
jgi:hypothetical protein